MKATLIKEVFYHYFYAKNKSIATATEDSIKQKLLYFYLGVLEVIFV
jgi:hypothetical protein